LRRALETALRETGYVDLHSVNIDVTDGNVRLTGTVRSYFIKQKAQIVVGAMAGTVPIDNAISVTGTGPPAPCEPRAAEIFDNGSRDTPR
jgi:osmotically-inducible protein OsmY